MRLHARKYLLLFVIIACSFTFGEELFPMYFGSEPTTDEEKTLQMQDWRYITKFKIFGAEGIKFTGNNINIPEPTGWFGTSDGNFDMLNSGNNHSVGGPIVIGGSMILGNGSDKFLTGPIRIEKQNAGNIEMPNQGWKDGENSFIGPVCVSGNVNSYVDKFISADNQFYSGKKGYGNCPDTVPLVKHGLGVPSFVVPSDDKISADIKADGSRERETFVDIPPGEADEPYDIYLHNIEATNTGRLVFRMQAGGRLTRVFVQKITFSAQPKIYVSYMNEGAVYDNEGGRKWGVDGNTWKTLSGDQYKGNLLIYSTEDIVVNSASNADTLQGTYISEKSIIIKNQITLIGQLLAKNIEIGANFGNNFRFVPFNSSKIDPGTLAEGQYKENEIWTKINVKLDTISENAVSFNYCFYTPGGEKGGYNFASDDDLLDDLLDEEDRKMPRCKVGSGTDKGDSGFVYIKAGELTPVNDEDNAWVRITRDNENEGTEYFYFCIRNLSGAIVKGAYDTEEGFNGLGACIPLPILDDDNNAPLPYGANELNVPEHTKGEVAGFIEAYDNERDPFDFTIVGGTGKDLFELSDPAPVANAEGHLRVEVKLKSNVEVDFEKTSRYTLKVEFNDHQQKNSTKVEEFTVIVIDINEAPTMEDVQTSKKENETGFVEYLDFDDLDIESKFKHDKFKLKEESEIFEIRDDALWLKDGVTLDYEIQTEYKLDIIVYDSTDVSLADTAIITVKVKNEDDGPKINKKDSIPDTLHIIIDPIPGIPLISLRNGDKLGVEENNEAKAVAGQVVATCTAVGCDKTLTYEILVNAEDLFEIDPKTGIIKVKEENVLDYEQKNKYEILVRVCDNNPGIPQSDSAYVMINVIDVNETPSLEDGALAVDEESPVGTLVGLLDTLTSDLDTSAAFTKHYYKAIGGDTAIFKVDSATGKIFTRMVLNYEKDLHSYSLNVKVFDFENPALTDEAVMKIGLLNIIDPPYLTEDKFEILENPHKDAVVGTLDAASEEGTDKFKYELTEPSKIVVVDEDGTIKVSDSTYFDFETNPFVKVPITITDLTNGATSDTVITIKVIDVNEPVTLPPQTIPVKEDEKVGTIIKKLVADDLDTAKKFTQHEFKLVGKSDKFEVASNGEIKLVGELDYETDSVYVIKVSVTDGEFTDTADVKIQVLNVAEPSVVIITRAENKDSIWLLPDTIYTNLTDLDLEWTVDGDVKYGSEKLKDGKNVIIKSFKGEKMDLPGADTLIVYVSQESPIVEISTKSPDAEKDNIYTIVEEREPGDESVYVNRKKNDVFVKVKDPSFNSTDTFTVKISLDTLNISSKVLDVMAKIAKSKIKLDESSSTEKTRVRVNDDKIQVSYTQKIEGQNVTISYFTDLKGKVLKGESGKKELTVSYRTNVNGRDVDVSFVVDASTGKRIKQEDGSSYKVSYEYTDSNNNEVTISYGINEKGAHVKNSEGNVEYNVSYTYVNKYHNSATETLNIVYDDVPPKVEIISPVEGEKVHSNFVNVIWSVDGEVQDSLVVQALDNGTRPIVRYYRDKAGNLDSAVVFVYVKGGKDLDISVETPVTIVKREDIEEFYAENTPKKGETFAVSIFNDKDQKENEVLIGGDFKNKKGSGDEPYAGRKGHLGPTLVLDTKLPMVTNVGGLATLDDLIGSDGKVNIDGVDAKNGRKVSVSQYVDEYCDVDFSRDMGADYSKANLYNTEMTANIWIYTNLGQFVDKYKFKLDLNDPDYVNDAGLLSAYFELKPDENGYIRGENGRNYATGAYVFRTEVTMDSKLRCTLPPVDSKKGTGYKGFKRRVKDDLLKSFGYKRPSDK